MGEPGFNGFEPVVEAVPKPGRGIAENRGPKDPANINWRPDSIFMDNLEAGSH